MPQQDQSSDFRYGVGRGPVVDKVGGHPTDALSPTALKQFRDEIEAMDKAMRDWEPVADEAARKRQRRPPSSLKTTFSVLRG
jgi:hypothetical protein